MIDVTSAACVCAFWLVLACALPRVLSLFEAGDAAQTVWARGWERGRAGQHLPVGIVGFAELAIGVARSRMDASPVSAFNARYALLPCIEERVKDDKI